MSEADDFKDVKRTPKARDGDLQEGRPHPALRVYGADYGEAVSYEVARDRMAARKKGDLPIIKGGLDDNDPSLEIKGVGLPGPYKMSHLSNKPKTAKNAEPVPDAPSSVEKPVPVSVPVPKTPIEELMDKVKAMEPGSVEAMVEAGEEPKAQDPKRRKEKSRPADGLKEVSDVLKDVVACLAYMKARPASQSPVDGKPSPPKSRTRVEVATGQMTFNVPAVDYIRCAGGVALMLPDSGDSTTFIPATGTSAVLSCQSAKARDEVVFTGISFHLEALGCLCLVFAFRPSAKSPHPRQDPPKAREDAVPQLGKPDPGFSGSVLDAVKLG